MSSVNDQSTQAHGVHAPLPTPPRQDGSPRSPVLLSRLALAAILLSCVAQVAGSVHLERLRARIGDPTVTLAWFEDWERVGLLIDASAIVLYLVSLLLTGIWLFRCRRNVELLASVSFRRRSGWCIGGWFCPVVNMWFPYQCVADAWVASDPKRDWTSSFWTTSFRTHVLVKVWWIVTILTWIGDRMIESRFDRALESADPDAFSSAIDMMHLFLPVYLVTSICLAAVIVTITRWQRVRVEGAARRDVLTVGSPG